MITTDQYQLEYERIRILYGNMPGITIGVLLMTVFCALFLNNTLPSGYAGIWAICAVMAIGPRLLVANTFNKGVITQSITPLNVQRWENYWVLTGVPIGLAFSSLSFFPYASALSLAGVAVLLSVFSTASVLTTNTSYKAVGVTAAIVVLPLAYHLFRQGGEFFIMLGVFYLFVLIVFGSYVLRLHQTLLENIRLKIENENISLTDQLTNLWNRRGLHFFVEKLIPRSQRSKDPFTFVMLDVDHFKQFNDKYGHNAGDVQLARVATCIEQETRDGDLVVRYGGEEFLIVLPATNMEQTREVADRVCRNVRENTEVTISGGLAIFRPDMTVRDLLEEADRALYAAKATGRDRFVVFDEINKAA